MAPSATSSAAFVTAGTSKRSEKSIDQICLVFATQSLIASNCAKLVQPGLSLMTSLPAFIAFIAHPARSFGMPDSKIKSISGSLSKSSAFMILGTFSNRLIKPGSVSGSPSVDQPTNSAPMSIIF